MRSMVARVVALFSFMVLASCGLAQPALATPATAIAASSSVHVGVIAANKRRGTVVVVTPASVTYDTSMGTAVDANGFATLPLRTGAHAYFVNSSTGSDSNTCTQAKDDPTHPMATVVAAHTCVVDGEGDKVLIAQDTSYAAGLPGDWPNFMKSGFSPQYPYAFESYDPADPTNQAKWGRATGTHRPVLDTGATSFNFIGGNPYSYVAVRGLDFNPGNVANLSISNGSAGASLSNYILFENDIFRYIGLGFDHSSSKFNNPGHKFIFRNNASYGQWYPCSCVGLQGVYIANIEGVTFEDSVFYHNGWKVGLLDTDPASSGGHNAFNHSLYLQSNTYNVVVRRNVFVDGSADGGNLKGDGIYQGNFSLRNPIGLTAGGGNLYSLAHPFGASYDFTGNAVLLSNTLNGAGATAWGMTSNNGISSTLATFRYNVLARNDQTLATSNAFVLRNLSDPNIFYTINDQTNFDHNVVYSWASPGQNILSVPNYATFTNNLWDDATSGSNTNNGSTVFPNAYTESSLLSALGYASESAAVTDWINNPDQHKWRTATSLMLTGYGVTIPAQFDLQTDMRITAGVKARGLFVGTHDGFDLTVISGKPSCVTLDSGGRAWYADTSCTAGAISMVIRESNGTLSHDSTISGAIYAAPVLSSLSVTPGTTTATVNVSTNVGSGNLYAAVGSATATTNPWPAIRAGYIDATYTVGAPGDSYVAAAAAAAQAVTATGAQSPIAITGLTASTAYRLQAVQVDANHNASVVSTYDFTTTSGAPTTSWAAATGWTVSGTNNNIATLCDGCGWASIKANHASASASYVLAINNDGSGNFYVGLAGTGSADFCAFDSSCVAYDTHSGNVRLGGSTVATVAASVAGDCIKVTNSSGTVNFYKQTGCTGSFALIAGPYDASALGTSLYPSITAAPGGASAQGTADFTLWSFLFGGAPMFRRRRRKAANDNTELREAA